MTEKKQQEELEAQVVDEHVSEASSPEDILSPGTEENPVGDDADPEALMEADDAARDPAVRPGWLWLLLLVAGLPVVTLGALKVLPEGSQQLLAGWLFPAMTEPKVVTHEVIKEVIKEVPVEVPVPAEPAAAPADTAASVVVDDAALKAAQAESESLQNTVKALQGELDVLHGQQAMWEQGQQEVRQRTLRIRLDWAAQAGNHLPQLVRAWDAISLAPGLDDMDKLEVERLFKLAQARQADVKHWRQQLQTVVDSLPLVPEAHSGTVSEQPWLNWLLQQFSFRRAAAVSVQELAPLREELLRVSQGLAFEQWPDAERWQNLQVQLNEVLLRSGRPPVDGLPQAEDFTAAAADVAQLRQSAQSWLERLP